MVNATYLQYCQVAGLRRGPAQPPGHRGAPTPRERGAILVGRDPVAESEPSRRQVRVPARLRRARASTPTSPATSPSSARPASSRARTTCSPATTTLLFVTKLVDLLRQRPAQGRQRPADHRPEPRRTRPSTALEGLPGDVQGAVVALEPDTGKILAMVSLPTFDPNTLASHDFGAVERDLRRARRPTTTEPLLNRAIQTTLPPGSTFKLVTAAAAIENGNYHADRRGAGRRDLPAARRPPTTAG